MSRPDLGQTVTCIVHNSGVLFHFVLSLRVHSAIPGDGGGAPTDEDIRRACPGEPEGVAPGG